MLKKLKLRQRYDNSIAFRYLSIASICLIVLQLVFGASQSYRIYQQKVDSLEEKAQGKLKFITAVVQPAILRSDRGTLRNILQINNQDKDIIYGVVLNKNAEIISQAIAIDKLAVNKLVKQQDITAESNIISFLSSHKSVVELSRLIQLGDYNLGEVRIGYSLENANQELIKAALYHLYSSILISTLFIALTIIIFNKQILKPIQKLQDLAQSIAAGNLDTRVTVERQDELGKLSSALNSMTLQIEHTLKNLEKAIEDALIAEKAKSKFMAKMSHELRTPLNGIIGFTQIMKQESTTTVEQLENLDIIEENSLHLLNLINDVLEITRIESGKSSVNYNSFNLHKLLQSLEQMFDFKAKDKGIKLLFKISSNVPEYVETDQDKLRQIIFNLLDNSIKFTEQGAIRLNVKYKPDQERDYLYNLYFKIADTGVGISPAEIDNLFVAFAKTETGENSHQGIGLGLPMSRQLIQLLGGDISIKSEVNQGTVIRFFIPVSEADMSEISFQGYYATDSQSIGGDSLDSQFFCQPSSSYDLAEKKINSMPKEWLLKLQDATVKVDNEIILELLQEIPNDAHVLSQAMNDLVENFRYDSILELIEKALDQ